MDTRRQNGFRTQIGAEKTPVGTLLESINTGPRRAAPPSASRPSTLVYQPTLQSSEHAMRFTSVITAAVVFGAQGRFFLIVLLSLTDPRICSFGRLR